MPKRIRLASVCGAAMLIFALVFSLFFVAAEADHECNEEHCAVCHQIQICQTILEQLSTAHAATTGAVTLCFFVLPFVLWTQKAMVASSPVLLRVKLLN